MTLVKQFQSCCQEVWTLWYSRKTNIYVKDFTWALLTASGGSMSAASPKKLQKCGVLREGQIQHQAKQRPKARPDRPQKQFLALCPLRTKVKAATHLRLSDIARPLQHFALAKHNFDVVLQK